MPVVIRPKNSSDSRGSSSLPSLPDRPNFTRFGVHPSIVIFVFRNAIGIHPRKVTVSAADLAGGMERILDLMARQMGCKISKLCWPDSRSVSDTKELSNYEAYVAVPTGEKFRETRYYVPPELLDRRVRGARSTGSKSTSTASTSSNSDAVSPYASLHRRRTVPRDFAQTRYEVGAGSRESSPDRHVRGTSAMSLNPSVADLEELWVQKMKDNVYNDAVSRGSFDSDCSFKTNMVPPTVGNNLAVPTARAPRPVKNTQVRRRTTDPNSGHAASRPVRRRSPSNGGRSYSAESIRYRRRDRSNDDKRYYYQEKRRERLPYISRPRR